MPSLFPGMDPFIEDQEWDGFHLSFNVTAAEALGPLLEPKYVARIQRRANDWRERQLVIRKVPVMEVVTVIETLCPPDKEHDRDRYLAKREVLLEGGTNLVEIDMLRGGKRLPGVGMPAGDYFALVSRGHNRPKTDVYPWTLRQPLPTIPVPLKKDEPEIPLNLQDVFTTVYDRARYHLSLNYAAKLCVPLSEADSGWVRTVVDRREG